MINLIPTEEKKRMVMDFYHRFAIMLLFVSGLAVLVASAVLLPSYFAVSVKEQTVDQKLQTQANAPISTSDQALLDQVDDLKKKLGLIESLHKESFLISQKVISEIVSQKMPDIKITQLSYEDNVAEGKKIQISGTAPSRERLLQFKMALSADSSFTKVELPISNFVKGSDINFYITLFAS